MFYAKSSLNGLEAAITGMGDDGDDVVMTDDSFVAPDAGSTSETAQMPQTPAVDTAPLPPETPAAPVSIFQNTPPPANLTTTVSLAPSLTVGAQYLNPAVNYFSNLSTALNAYVNSSAAATANPTGYKSFENALDAVHSLTGTLGLVPSAADVAQALQNAGVDVSAAGFGPALAAFATDYLNTYSDNKLLQQVSLEHLQPVVAGLVGGINYSQQAFTAGKQAPVVQPVNIAQQMQAQYASVQFEPLQMLSSDPNEAAAQTQFAQNVLNGVSHVVLATAGAEGINLGYAFATSGTAAALEDVTAMIAVPWATKQIVTQTVQAPLQGLGWLNDLPNSVAKQNAAINMALLFTMHQIDKLAPKIMKQVRAQHKAKTVKAKPQHLRQVRKLKGLGEESPLQSLLAGAVIFTGILMVRSLLGGTKRGL